MSKIDNPVSKTNKMKFLELLTKREEYLKERKKKLVSEINSLDKYDGELNYSLTFCSGSLSEVSFIAQLVYLLGVDNE